VRRGVVAVGIAAAAIGAVAPLTAEAQYATGGSGQYKGSIDWFEWGTEGQAIPNAGTTVSNTRDIGGQELETSCTIGAHSGAMNVATYGDWGGTGLDDLYNVGGTGAANALAAGLSVSASTVTFPLSCAATLDGLPIPLAGLVMADAEQSVSNEFVQAKIDPSATWRIVDRFRSNGCTSSAIADLSADNTLRLTQPAACGVGPMAVGFMDGATSAEVTIKGGGTSILALGVVLNADFTDAPASYGAKAALLPGHFSGGTVPVGTTAISGDDFALATLDTPSPRLGATVTSDGGPQPSALADADGGDDGVASTSTGTVHRGHAYTLDDVACTGSGVVGAWLDWNRDGDFADPADASTTAPCVGGTASVSWTIPADAVDSEGATPSFLRVAIGPDAASVASPTGVMPSGEVEDSAYQVVIPANEPPTATVAGPVEGGTYFQGQSVPAAYSCSDPDGTVASCVGTVPTGADVDTSTTGSHTFTATATDDQGDTGSSSVSYRVVPTVGACRGQALGLLGINLAVANGPLTPCVTKDGSIVHLAETLGAPSILAILNNTVTADALLAHSASGPGSAAADASIAKASITIPALALNIQVTGLASTARSQLSSCAAPATLTSSSKIGSLKVNGLTIPVLDGQSLTIPLVIGSLSINQTVVSGNTIGRRALFLDLPGTALDVVLAESIAGAVCGTPPTVT
jgi:hypothetical protein